MSNSPEVSQPTLHLLLQACRTVPRQPPFLRPPWLPSCGPAARRRAPPAAAGSTTTWAGARMLASAAGALQGLFPHPAGEQGLASPGLPATAATPLTPAAARRDAMALAQTRLMAYLLDSGELVLEDSRGRAPGPGAANAPDNDRRTRATGQWRPSATGQCQPATLLQAWLIFGMFFVCCRWPVAFSVRQQAASCACAAGAEPGHPGPEQATAILRHQPDAVRAAAGHRRHGLPCSACQA